MNIELTGEGIFEFFNKFWNVIYNSSDVECIRLLVIISALCIAYTIWGNAYEKKYLGWQNLIVLVALFSPMSMELLSKSSFVQVRYFRFLWLLPYPIVLAYSMVKYTDYFQNLIKKRNECGNKLREKIGNNIYYIFSAILIVVTISYAIRGTERIYTRREQNQGLNLVDNIYKVEADTLEAAEIIEADKKDASKMVKVLYDYDFYLDIRTYDPSLSFYSYYVSDGSYRHRTLTEQDLLCIYNSGNYDYTLYMLVASAGMKKKENFPFETEDINTMLRQCEIDYVILSKTSNISTKLKKCGERLGETEHYWVYKVNETE